MTGQKDIATLRLARECAVRQLELRIAAEPESIGLGIERGRLLTELGRTQEARDVYLEVLARAPYNRLALNELGTLLHAGGYRTAARTAFTEAAARHPADAMSHINLANVLYEAGELAPAREHYETALRHSTESPEGHQGMAHVLAEMGDVQRAAWHRRKGFEHRSVRTLPYRGEGNPVLLLELVSASGGNILTRNLLDDRLFETTIIVPEFYDLNLPLPPHQLVFNAIGDADRAADALASAQLVAGLASAPVLNLPTAVMATGRADNAQRLSRLPGVITPVTVTLPREVLSSSDSSAALARHGLEFPLLIRAPGFHTGRHFVFIERADEMAQAVAALPGPALTAIQYLDSRGNDGKVRKYRVMMIDGRLHPLHLAVSSHWKVHYFSAEMGENAEHRVEEAKFLESMPTALGERAMNALEHIQRAMGLDYAGIDFGLSPSGDLLLFEANATMVVNAPAPDERWTYRRPAVEAILAAVHRMVLQRANPRARRLAI